MTFKKFGFMLTKETVTLTNTKLIWTNPKLTINLNPTLLTKDPSMQYWYYDKLRVATADSDDTMSLGSFTQVCLVKFIYFSNGVILFCNLACDTVCTCI